MVHGLRNVKQLDVGDHYQVTPRYMFSYCRRFTVNAANPHLCPQLVCVTGVAGGYRHLASTPHPSGSADRL